MHSYAGKKIMIVDDTETNIDVLVEALGDLYPLVVATNGSDALELMPVQRPDLILLDIMMPGMDGYETCRRLKTDPATRDIPVIFVTAMSEVEDETHGLEVGAVDYIVKPIRPSIVRARVRNHLTLADQRCQMEGQNQELIEAARLREDVDRIMRHDLKSPLNTIIGFPELIRMTGALSDKQSVYLGYIEESGRRMLNMINLSLDLFKMERGIYELKPEPVDIMKILKSMSTEMQALIGQRQIAVNIQMDGNPTSGDTPLMVRGEPLLCYSLFSNLVKNAVEASSYGACVTIFVEQNGARVMFRIHNDGAVPPEKRDRFFEKYATSRKTTGTGLGTYSARMIALTQTGEIHMQTSETEGTTVMVDLPAWRA